MRKPRAMVVAAATALCVPALFVPTAAAAAGDLSLPAPTGHNAVGRATLALTDRTRTDPWVPEAGPRQLMVTMYYPAVRSTGSQAPYMDVAEAGALVDHYEIRAQLPPEKLARARTWSRTDARPLPGKRPLVLLSPGYTVSRYSLTALAEDLASRGYITAAVDHAFESVAAKFPGGVLPCAACDLPDKIGHGPIALNRATDLSFVLNELRNHPLIDQRHIAVVGHSMGGDAAATVMRADSRVDAGINMDGPMLPPDPLNRPFLLFGGPELHEPGHAKDTSWDAVWPHMSGWKRWLHAPDADHFSFTDLNLLIQQAGIDPPTPLEPARGISLTRTYVAAFVDQHLRGIPQVVLSGPTAEFPEIEFHNLR